MLTRKMSENIAERIQELERLLDQQQLQLERLQNGPRSNVEQRPTAPVTNFDPTKIPDIIKIIPGYSGVERELPSWLESVEKKLECAKTFVPEDKLDLVMPIWHSLIRDKITGKANEALLMSNTDCKWEAIKTKLKERFGDKRDLSTILNKIPYLRQSNKNVEEFYVECDGLLSDINAKIMLDDNMRLCAQTVMASYEAMITNAYIDGLHEPISSLTRTSRPDSLLSAYQHALDQSNAANRRKERTKIETKSNPEPSKYPRPQPIPFRNGVWNQTIRPSYPPGFNPNTRAPLPFNNYGNNPNTRPPYASGNNNFQRAPYPSGGYNNMNNQSRPGDQTQIQGSRQYPAIKQEVPSTSNFKKYQSINVHDEQSTHENNDWIDSQEQNSNNEFYQDQLTQENYPESDDLNFQSTPSEGTET